MSLWKWLLVTMAALSLAACGGGGSNAGTPVLGGNSGSVADVVIVLSADTVANTGANTVTATITVVDANRAGLANVNVTAAVDANAVISLSSTKTDATGKVTATIGIGSDLTNRVINVTASAGNVTKATTLRVVTDPSASNPVAEDLSLVLSAPSVTNGGSATITATATGVDRNRNVVAGIPVTFSVDASATLAADSAKTDAAGKVTAIVGIGSDRSNRVVTVTATSGTLVRTASFSVTGARLTASAAPAVTAGTAGNTIEYTLVDFNGIAMYDQSITVTGNGLPNSSGKTDLNGKFRYTYTAPNLATTLQIVAVAAGDQRTSTVTVTDAGGSVAAAPEFPVSASVTPTPSVVTVNSVGSNTNQVELRVLFIGANNQPVPRVRVRFDLAGNSSSTDGVISWVGSYAYSDASGIARGTFTPGQLPSPTNGITIRACYDTVDFSSGASSACSGVPNATTSTLTVASEALSVNIRTNNLIGEGARKLTYIKEYAVMVVDSAGRAKADVQITPSVDLTGYYKGSYAWNGTRWVQVISLSAGEVYRWNGASWEKDGSANPNQPVCPNEDVNRNGVREASSFVAGAAAPGLSLRGEDLNWNGDLDPRKADVAVSMIGSSKTDANGIAYLQIEYGKNVATWVDFAITVTASGVSGTEARARYIGNLYGLGNLPALASDTTQETVAPPFVVSPYGTNKLCTAAD